MINESPNTARSKRHPAPRQDERLRTRRAPSRTVSELGRPSLRDPRADAPRNFLTCLWTSQCSRAPEHGGRLKRPSGARGISHCSAGA